MTKIKGEISEIFKKYLDAVYDDIFKNKIELNFEKVMKGKNEMRNIDTHKVNPANDRLEITVLDQPGSGNANHHYRIKGPDNLIVELHFQNGPINEAGVNGITHETLIAILIDRLQNFRLFGF